MRTVKSNLMKKSFKYFTVNCRNGETNEELKKKKILPDLLYMYSFIFPLGLLLCRYQGHFFKCTGATYHFLGQISILLLFLAWA